MTPTELKELLRRLGISQVGFGQLLGVHGRAAQRWCSDDTEQIPGPVAMIAGLLNERPELLEVVRRLADERDRAAARRAARKK